MTGGMGGGSVIGWDLGAAMRMAEALGFDLMVVASVLPELEAIVCAAVNERNRAEE